MDCYTIIGLSNNRSSNFLVNQKSKLGPYLAISLEITTKLSKRPKGVMGYRLISVFAIEVICMLPKVSSLFIELRSCILFTTLAEEPKFHNYRHHFLRIVTNRLLTQYAQKCEVWWISVWELSWPSKPSWYIHHKLY